MHKKRIIIITLISIISIILIIVGYLIYEHYRIVNAKIEVKLVNDKVIEVYDKKRISDFIESINGKLIKDKLIDTNSIGEKIIKFDFINDDNIKVSYSFKIKVEDKTPPIIGVPSSYTLTKGSDEDLSKSFFCGDNYDNEPLCSVEGEYDKEKVGSYSLTYKAKDSSDNQVEQKFTLYVKEPEKPSNNNSKPNYRYLEDVIKEHKNENTKIGIDISHWQGNINFKQVKESGIEFVFIRVGTENQEGELYLDKKFEQNIKGFNEVGIPVGIYYYSYADSISKAKKEANWVIKQIKKYKIDLPVVFDWENWSNFREYNLSFHSLTEVASAYLDTIKKAGYEPMLYSSKYYLENIWYKTDYKTWLAHYTTKTNYEGDYYIWQLCSNGKVDGIPDNVVDLNVMYLK